MSTAFTIRRAVPDDVEAIASVQAESWRETYADLVGDPDHTVFAVEWRVNMWERLLADAEQERPVVAVVANATGGEAIIGFAAAAPSEGEDVVRPLELTMLYLLAEAHGSGAGQALLDAVLGDRPASLWVAQVNPRAHAFYRRNGFAPDGATMTFPPLGEAVRLVR